MIKSNYMEMHLCEYYTGKVSSGKLGQEFTMALSCDWCLLLFLLREDFCYKGISVAEL
jgi:hypothetical protein